MVTLSLLNIQKLRHAGNELGHRGPDDLALFI